MKITIAKTAGFCMGVRRAVEMVLDAPARYEAPIQTFGPLIHNPQVLDLLTEKGIRCFEHIPARGTGTILVRAHGIPPRTRAGLIAAGFNLIDATCPRVIKVQAIIRQHAGQGYAVIIIGDTDHPEVQGLLGYAGARGVVAENLEAVTSLPAFAKAIVVAQTTLNTRSFEEIQAWLQTTFPHYKRFNTICDSTAKRQAEVIQLAAGVDAVVVVGGYKSGNTQRLAEIARQTGKPAVHIEKAEDLNSDWLAPFSHIGITAGASTPNWVINRVYRHIEEMPMKHCAGWRHRVYNLQRTLLLTTLYVSLGAGALGYACIKLQGAPPHFSYMLISMLYVLSMHILNNLIGNQADHYNDPTRASFYARYKMRLGGLAVGAGAAGLYLAASHGRTPFLALLIMSILGLAYNIRLIPGRLEHLPFHRIRDLPGSKTILIAVAWGLVTAVLPVLSLRGPGTLATLVVFVWATGLVFVRTAFFDILDMQGDRIVGRETLPLILGQKKTYILLQTLLGLLIVLFPLAAWVGMLMPRASLLAVCPLLMLLVLRAYQEGTILPGVRLEFLVESHFVLAGGLALVI